VSCILTGKSNAPGALNVFSPSLLLGPTHLDVIPFDSFASPYTLKFPLLTPETKHQISVFFFFLSFFFSFQFSTLGISSPFAIFKIPFHYSHPLSIFLRIVHPHYIQSFHRHACSYMHGLSRTSVVDLR